MQCVQSCEMAPYSTVIMAHPVGSHTSRTSPSSWVFLVDAARVLVMWCCVHLYRIENCRPSSSTESQHRRRPSIGLTVVELSGGCLRSPLCGVRECRFYCHNFDSCAVERRSSLDPEPRYTAAVLGCCRRRPSRRIDRHPRLKV